VLSAAVLLCGGLVWAQAQTQRAATEAIPDFSGGGRTWVLTGGTQFYKVPGDTGPGPIDDKNYPNGKFSELGGGGARTGQSHRRYQQSHPEALGEEADGHCQ
jgi:hypothetical protein